MPSLKSFTLAERDAGCTQRVAVFPTEIGWIAISMSGNVLQRLSFGHRSPQSAAAAIERRFQPNHDSSLLQDDSVGDLVDRLTRYAAGNFDDFFDVAIETCHFSPFSRAIIEAVRRIPFGQTRSYGRVAASAGRPRAARAVGRVMAKNRTPLVVPCHRVVASGGLLGGFSAVDGLAMKRRLLKLEAPSLILAR